LSRGEIEEQKQRYGKQKLYALTNGQWIHNALEIPLIKTKKNIKKVLTD
jgi:hypothetical protein